MTKIILNAPKLSNYRDGGIDATAAILDHVRDRYDPTAILEVAPETDLDTVLAEVRSLAAAPPTPPTRDDLRALDRAVGEQVRNLKEWTAYRDDAVPEGKVDGLLDDLYDLVADTVTAWASGRAAEVEQDDDLPDVEDRPETDYGVRLHFADDTVLDVDNIDGLQVYEKGSHRFPFGFMPVVTDEEAAEVEHRAGYYRAEDGIFMPFTGEQAPRPFNSFGG